MNDGLNKEIPQRLWEDYVAARDEMIKMEERPMDDLEATKRRSIAREKYFAIVAEYDEEILNLRYVESLKKDY